MTSNADKLAIDGGTPVRDVRKKPWPGWPQVSEDKWRARVEPALKAVYLSGCEGLPGPKAQAFGAAFAEYCCAKHGRMVTSGTTALGAALAAALDLNVWDSGAEVILPNYTFIATASAALDRRCSLTFVDIDRETLTIDPDAVEAAIVPGRTKAILAVHILGHPADMARLNAMAKKHGLVVVEDCAQAHGAESELGRVGALGDAAGFSFQSSKNLTSGEGGVVTTNDSQVDARVVAFMDVGRNPSEYRWDYARLGWNYRPSEYLAALLSVRLEDLEEQIALRSKNAGALTRFLADVPGVTPAQWGPWCRRHAYHLYPMLVDPAAFGGKSRDEIAAAAGAEGVPCWPGYKDLLSDSPAIQEQMRRFPETIRVMDCPNTRFVCDQSLWLGQSMLLGDESDMEDVVRTLGKIQKAWGR